MLLEWTSAGPAKRILNGKPEGRPLLRWEVAVDNVVTVLGERNWKNPARNNTSGRIFYRRLWLKKGHFINDDKEL
jgi:hypothetical protein